MPGIKGKPRPDVAARNKVAAKVNTKSLKNTEVAMLNKAIQETEKEVLGNVSKEYGCDPSKIWTRLEFVEKMRAAFDLDELSMAILQAMEVLKKNVDPRVALQIMRTIFEYIIQKAPDDAKDTAGLPPINIIYPKEPE